MLRAGTAAELPGSGSQAIRLGWLDALRGIAALSVVFEHLSHTALKPIRDHVNLWFSPGLYGIMVFFLVSGYIVPASLERRGSVRGFWVSRIFRLYPLFLVAAVLKLVLSGLHLATDTVDDVGLSALGHVFMLQDLLGVVPLINVMWTLSYEMAFYLIITLLFVAGVHRASAGFATGFACASLLLGGILPQVALSHSSLGSRVVAVGVTAAIAVGLAGAQTGLASLRVGGAVIAGGTALVLLSFNQRVSPWQGLAILAVMLTGTALYRAEQRQVGWAKAICAAIAVFALAVASGLWHLWEVHNPSMLVYQRQWAVSVLLAGATFATAMACRRHRLPRFLSWLGTISYSLYLMHMLLIDLFVRLPWAQPGQAPVIQAGLAASFLALLLGCCWLTYRAVEMPAQRLGRRLAAWLDARFELPHGRARPAISAATAGDRAPAALARQRVPAPERVRQARREHQRTEHPWAGPPGVGGVVTGREPAADDRGRIVVDVEDAIAGPRPLDRSQALTWRDP
jgi:peptidoglycan/LPS O-acetylase OafA/YrhL